MIPLFVFTSHTSHCCEGGVAYTLASNLMCRFIFAIPTHQKKIAKQFNFCQHNCKSSLIFCLYFLGEQYTHDLKFKHLNSKKKINSSCN